MLLIARAPLQLFQAIQTSLLPHLTGLEATAGHEAFARAVRITSGDRRLRRAVALGLLIVGPFAMGHVFFGQHYSYGRSGLALIGVGMGLHLSSGALNQAALARDRARAAASAGCWRPCVFLAWMLAPAVGDQLLRAEIGYAGATALLALCCVLYRRGSGDRRLARASAQRRPARGDRAVGLAPGSGLGGGRSPSPPRTASRPPRGSAGPCPGRCRRRPRPPTLLADAAPRSARRASASECSMNGCPPQPGLTVMHSAMSIVARELGERPGGLAGLIATPTPAPRSRIGRPRRRGGAWPRRGR